MGASVWASWNPFSHSPTNGKSVHETGSAPVEVVTAWLHPGYHTPRRFPHDHCSSPDLCDTNHLLPLMVCRLVCHGASLDDVESTRWPGCFDLLTFTGRRASDPRHGVMSSEESSSLEAPAGVRASYARSIGVGTRTAPSNRSPAFVRTVLVVVVRMVEAASNQRSARLRGLLAIWLEPVERHLGRRGDTPRSRAVSPTSPLP
jgi:hypothetical protein